MKEYYMKELSRNNWNESDFDDDRDENVLKDVVVEKLNRIIKHLRNQKATAKITFLPNLSNVLKKSAPYQSVESIELLDYLTIS